MKDVNELLKEFNSIRMANIDVSSSVVFEDKKKPKKKKPKPIEEKAYVSKLEKGDFESLTSKDMIEYFVDLSKETQFPYTPNYQIDVRNMNLMQERGYSKEDIVLMMEFLFRSDQSYLDRRKIHPGILLTGWCNSIHPDSHDWRQGKFVDRRFRPVAKKKSYVEEREWSEPVEKTAKVKIGGGWGE